MRVPVTLFDVRKGTTADDPAAITIGTVRDQARADAVAQFLERRRLTADLETDGAFFVVPREAEIEELGASAAALRGYQVRTVLAPVEDAVLDEAEDPPPDEAPPLEAEPAGEQKAPGEEEQP